MSHLADMATLRPRVYLAGPEVFLPNAQQIGEQKKRICFRHGLEGVFPLDAVPDEAERPQDTGFAIFEICISMMNDCQLAVANLTPFRGVSMDIGTAIELGYMFGMHKPVFGYTNVIEDYMTRVEESDLGGELQVEDFGLVDNLMCEGVIRRSGGEVIRRNVAPDARLSDLQGFEDCVRQAVRVLNRPEKEGARTG